MEIGSSPNWMEPIIKYLERGILQEDANEAKTVTRQSAHYALIVESLYKRGYSRRMMRCVTEPETTTILEEVDAGFCGAHLGGGRWPD